MALRKNITKTVEIPHEPGEHMEVRMLGWKQLDEAKKVRTKQSFANIKEMGGDVFKAIQDAKTDGSAAVADPLAEYDLETVLRAGIVSWSYDEPVTPETIGALDPQTAEWAARMILGFESAESRKNGFGPSTWPSVAEGQPPTSGS